jgi:hypothetical protein
MGNKEILFRALAQATSWATRNDVEEDDIKRERQATFFALEAILWFLRVEGAKPELMRLLLELAGNLNDLNDGKHPESLRPSAPSKNPGKLTNGTMEKIAACAMVDELRRGMPVETALTEVARMTGADAGSIKSWRKHLSAGAKGKNEQAAYSELRNQFRGLSLTQPRSVLKKGFQQIVQNPPSF